MRYDDVRKGFGLAIKDWRAKSGISQEELAWRAGLHRSYIADIERGARNASLQTIEKLAKGLGVSLSGLFSPLEVFREEIKSTANLPGAQPKQIEILLGESDPAQVTFTLTAWREARLRNLVHPLSDGTQILDFIYARGSFAQRPVTNIAPLLLLNLDLPGMSPLEVVRTIKTDERTRGVTIAVMTPAQESERVDEALRLGADTSVAKPVDFQSLARIAPKLAYSWTLRR